MPYFRLIVTFALSTLLASCLPQTVLAQAGVSSMSVGAGRAGVHRVGSAGQYMMPLPELFRVEEFVNYHRHDLPLPEDGRRVRLDVQQLELENGKSVVQVGITTPRAIDRDAMPPLNVVLVIDRSGSMDGEKMAHVKEAILAFVEQFRRSDRVTIVGFSNDACVHLEACDRTRIHKITEALDSIRAGGGTNLHAGLLLGYQQALENFDPERTNRVIFLTDGNANVGETESGEIVRQSKLCNDEGISLTTIGLGDDFNHGLLRELADAGRGTVHFVGDSKDIKKTFVKEIDSVLAPAARDVFLTLDFGSSSSSVKIYGYDPQRNDSQRKGRSGNRYKFKLDDLNHGATQVVIARLNEGADLLSGNATLKYVDAITGEETTLTQDLCEIVDRDGGRESVRRNYAIALVAGSIRAAAKASNEGECAKAEKRLCKGIDKARQLMDGCDDKNVERVIEIAEEYESKIHDSIARMKGRD